MTKYQSVRCDNPICNGGSDHYRECGNDHDICNCCSKELEERDYCPVCLDKAKLK